MRERGQSKCSFHFITLEEFINELVVLNDKKLLKLKTFLLNQGKSIYNCIFYIYDFNNSLSSSEYPASLKYADITPIFKKDDKTDEIN